MEIVVQVTMVRKSFSWKPIFSYLHEFEKGIANIANIYVKQPHNFCHSSTSSNWKGLKVAEYAHALPIVMTILIR